MRRSAATVSSCEQVSADGGGVSFGLASPTFWTALSLNVVFLILMPLDQHQACHKTSRSWTVRCD